MGGTEHLPPVMKNDVISPDQPCSLLDCSHADLLNGFTCGVSTIEITRAAEQDIDGVMGHHPHMIHMNNAACYVCPTCRSPSCQLVSHAVSLQLRYEHARQDMDNRWHWQYL